MIRVMLVDDSQTSRMLLKHIVNGAGDMQVVSELTDGKQAVEQVKKIRPDVILMDIVMPQIDGLEATEKIMEIRPTPIVMISGTLEGRETELAFQSIKKGALSLLAKPDGPEHPNFTAQATRLTSTLRAMSDVRVIHHRPAKTASNRPALAKVSATLEETPQIVGIASSTGGPAALAEICQNLHADFPLPLVIVQHIAAEFLPSLVHWLGQVSPLKAVLAPIGALPEPGHIYFAPVGRHLIFDRRGRFAQTDEPVYTHTPSGTVLLQSIASYYESAAIGVVLTGMGTDGAQGLLEMRQRGAVTIAQNEQTSAVYGMPGESSRIGAVQYSLALPMIAPFLNELIERVSS